MKTSLTFTLLIAATAAIAFGQLSLNQFEVELLTNPNRGGKDTREVNSVLVFEKLGLRVRSRRKDQTYKEFKYEDIKAVRHSYSKNAAFRMSRRTAAVLSLLTGTPLFLLSGKEEKHWLVLATDDDYAILKIENDNYRLIKMEFIVRKFPIVEINENEQ